MNTLLLDDDEYVLTCYHKLANDSDIGDDAGNSGSMQNNKSAKVYDGNAYDSYETLYEFNELYGPTCLEKKLFVLHMTLCSIYDESNAELHHFECYKKNCPSMHTLVELEPALKPVPLQKIPLPTQFGLKLFHRLCKRIRESNELAKNSGIIVKLASEIPTLLGSLPSCILSPGFSSPMLAEECDSRCGDGKLRVFVELLDLISTYLGCLQIESGNKISLNSDRHTPQLSIRDISILLTAYLSLSLKWGRLSYILQGVNYLVKYPTLISYDQIIDLHPMLTELSETKTELPNSLQKVKKRNKGYIMTFGKGDHGKLGLGRCNHAGCSDGNCTENQIVPTMLPTVKNVGFASIDSLSTHSAAITYDGNLMTWGNGDKFRLGHGSATKVYEPRQIDCAAFTGSVHTVACGLGHTLALLTSGDIYAWGNGSNGRLGLGDTSDRATPTRLPDVSSDSRAQNKESIKNFNVHFNRVFCGASHSIATTSNGQVFTCGKNNQGQCGLGHTMDQLLMEEVKFFGEEVEERVTEAAGGWEHTLFCTSAGHIYSCGSGYKDSRHSTAPPVLGHGNSERKILPTKIQYLVDAREKIKAIACGWDHSVAVAVSGAVYSWGSGTNGKLGHGSDDSCDIPVKISSVEGKHMVDAKAGCEHTILLSAECEVWTCGQGDSGRLGHGDNLSKKIPTKISYFEEQGLKPFAIAAGDKYNLVLVENPNIIKSPVTLDSSVCKEQEGCIKNAHSSERQHKITLMHRFKRVSYSPLCLVANTHGMDEALLVIDIAKRNRSSKLCSCAHLSSQQTVDLNNSPQELPVSVPGLVLSILGNLCRLNKQQPSSIEDFPYILSATTDILDKQHNHRGYLFNCAKDLTSCLQLVFQLTQHSVWALFVMNDTDGESSREFLEGWGHIERVALIFSSLRMLKSSIFWLLAITSENSNAFLLNIEIVHKFVLTVASCEEAELLLMLKVPDSELAGATPRPICTSSPCELVRLAHATICEASDLLKVGFHLFYSGTKQKIQMLYRLLQFDSTSSRTTKKEFSVLIKRYYHDDVVTEIMINLFAKCKNWTHSCGDSAEFTKKICEFLDNCSMQAAGKLDLESNVDEEVEISHAVLLLSRILYAHQFSLVLNYVSQNGLPASGRDMHEVNTNSYRICECVITSLLSLMGKLLVESKEILQKFHKVCCQHDEDITDRLQDTFIDLLLPNAIEGLCTLYFPPIVSVDTQMATSCKLATSFRFQIFKTLIPDLLPVLQLLDEINWKSQSNRLSTDKAKILSKIQENETSIYRFKLLQLEKICVQSVGFALEEILSQNRIEQNRIGMQLQTHFSIPGWADIIYSLSKKRSFSPAIVNCNNPIADIFKWEEAGVFETEHEICVAVPTGSASNPSDIEPSSSDDISNESASSSTFLQNQQAMILSLIEAREFQIRKHFWIWLAENSCTNFNKEKWANQAKQEDVIIYLFACITSIIFWQLRWVPELTTVSDKFSATAHLESLGIDFSSKERTLTCQQLLTLIFNAIIACPITLKSTDIEKINLNVKPLLEREPHPQYFKCFSSINSQSQPIQYQIMRGVSLRELLRFSLHHLQIPDLQSLATKHQQSLQLSNISLAIIHDLLRKLTISSAKKILLSVLNKSTQRVAHKLQHFDINGAQCFDSFRDRYTPLISLFDQIQLEDLCIRISKIISSHESAVNVKQQAIVMWVKLITDVPSDMLWDIIRKSRIIHVLSDLLCESTGVLDVDSRNFFENYGCLDDLTQSQNSNDTNLNYSPSHQLKQLILYRSPLKILRLLAWQTLKALTPYLFSTDDASPTYFIQILSQCHGQNNIELDWNGKGSFCSHRFNTQSPNWCAVNSPRKRNILPKKEYISTSKESNQQFLMCLFSLLTRLNNAMKECIQASKLLRNIYTHGNSVTSLSAVGFLFGTPLNFNLSSPTTFVKCHNSQQILKQIYASIKDSSRRKSFTLIAWFFVDPGITRASQSKSVDIDNNWFRLFTIGHPHPSEKFNQSRMPIGPGYDEAQGEILTLACRFSCTQQVKLAVLMKSPATINSTVELKTQIKHSKVIILENPVTIGRWTHVAILGSVNDIDQDINVYINGAKQAHSVHSVNRQENSGIEYNSKSIFSRSCDINLMNGIIFGGEINEPLTTYLSSIVVDPKYEKEMKRAMIRPKGIVDDVFLIPRLLSDKEISELAQRGLTIAQLKRESTVENHMISCLHTFYDMLQKLNHLSMLVSVEGDSPWIDLLLDIFVAATPFTQIQIFALKSMESLLPLIAPFSSMKLKSLICVAFDRVAAPVFDSNQSHDCLREKPTPISTRKLFWKFCNDQLPSHVYDDSVDHISLQQRNYLLYATMYNEGIFGPRSHHYNMNDLSEDKFSWDIIFMNSGAQYNLSNICHTSILTSNCIRILRLLYLRPLWKPLLEEIFSISVVAIRKLLSCPMELTEAPCNTELSHTCHDSDESRNAELSLYLITSTLFVGGYPESVINAGNEAEFCASYCTKMHMFPLEEPYASVFTLPIEDSTYSNCDEMILKLVNTMLLILFSNNGEELKQNKELDASHGIAKLSEMNMNIAIVLRLRSLVLRFIVLQSRRDKGVHRLWKIMDEDKLNFQTFVSKIFVLAMEPVKSNRNRFLHYPQQPSSTSVASYLTATCDVNSIGDLESMQWLSWDILNNKISNVNRDCERQLQMVEDSINVFKESPIVVLGGRVDVSQCIVTALEQFPTVRLRNDAITMNTGLWYYEIVILSEGLMQIGYIDSDFECDAEQGVGVGDHPNSWAFDGYRCKKWNVVSSDYGVRWCVGDVVGVLLDSDRKELSYYINGCQLGLAFSEIPFALSSKLHPAISLNVNQMVQFNPGTLRCAKDTMNHDNMLYKPNIIGREGNIIIQPITLLQNSGDGSLYETYPSTDKKDDESICGNFPSQLAYPNESQSRQSTNITGPLMSDGKLSSAISSMSGYVEEASELEMHGTDSEGIKNVNIRHEFLRLNFSEDMANHSFHQNCTRSENNISKLSNYIQGNADEESESQDENNLNSCSNSSSLQMNQDKLLSLRDTHVSSDQSSSKSCEKHALNLHKPNPFLQTFHSEIAHIKLLYPNQSPCTSLKYVNIDKQVNSQSNNWLNKLLDKSRTKCTVEKPMRISQQENVCFSSSRDYVGDHLKITFTDLTTAELLETCAHSSINLSAEYANELLFIFLSCEQQMPTGLLEHLYTNMCANLDANVMINYFKSILGLTWDMSNIYTRGMRIDRSSDEIVHLNKNVQHILRIELGPLQSGLTETNLSVDAPLYMTLFAELESQLHLMNNSISSGKSIAAERQECFVCLWVLWLFNLLVTDFEENFAKCSGNTSSMEENAYGLEQLLSRSLFSKSFSQTLLTLCFNPSVHCMTWKYVVFEIAKRILLLQSTIKKFHCEHQARAVGSILNSLLSSGMNEYLQTDHILEYFAKRCQIEQFRQLSYTPFTRLLLDFLVVNLQGSQRQITNLLLINETPMLPSSNLAFVDILHTGTTYITLQWSLFDINAIKQKIEGVENENLTRELDSENADKSDSNSRRHYIEVVMKRVSNLPLSSAESGSVNDDIKVIINENLSDKGVRSIKGLAPDTNYKIELFYVSEIYQHESRSNLTPSTELKRVSLVEKSLKTSPILPLLLYPDYCGKSLAVSNHNQSVRATMNKKWQTARCSTGFHSGTHCWDILIDRCISKNIFIGICTKDACLENYIGSDEYGYGFLANSAVWHNKVKYQSYGDVFRQGDHIRVTLDCDELTLSFSCNGIGYGIAAELNPGSVWHPAVSLYNRDDQITISPISVQPVEKLGSNYDSAYEQICNVCDCLTAQHIMEKIKPVRDNYAKEEQSFYKKVYEEWIGWSTGSLIFIQLDDGTVVSCHTNEEIAQRYSFRPGDSISLLTGICYVFGELNNQLYTLIKDENEKYTGREQIRCWSYHEWNDILANVNNDKINKSATSDWSPLDVPLNESMQWFVEVQSNWMEMPNSNECDQICLKIIEFMQTHLFNTSGLRCVMFSEIVGMLSKHDIISRIQELAHLILPIQDILARLSFLLSVNYRVLSSLGFLLPNFPYERINSLHHVRFFFDSVGHADEKDPSVDKFLSSHNYTSSFLDAILRSGTWLGNDPSMIKISPSWIHRCILNCQREAITDIIINDSMTQLDDKKANDTDTVESVLEIPTLQIVYTKAKILPFWNSFRQDDWKSCVILRERMDDSLFMQFSKQIAAHNISSWRLTSRTATVNALEYFQCFHIEVSTINDQNSIEGGGNGNLYLQFWEDLAFEVQSSNFPLFVPIDMQQYNTETDVDTYELDINLWLFSSNHLIPTRLSVSDVLDWYFKFGQLIGLSWRSGLVLPLQCLSISIWRGIVQYDINDPDSHIDSTNYKNAVDMIRSGILTIVPSQCLALNTAESLRKSVSDMELFILRDLSRRSVYDVESVNISYFWAVIENAKALERFWLKKLISQGHNMLPQNIEIYDQHILDQNSCVLIKPDGKMMRLFLPQCSTPQQMKTKLLEASLNYM